MLDVNSKLSKYLSLKFLSSGIQIFTGKSPENVAKIIKEKGKGFLLIEMDKTNSKWMNFFIHAKQYENEGNELFKLIVISDKTEIDFIQTLLLLGTHKLIQKKGGEEHVFKYLIKIVNESQFFTHTKREYQRVAPREADDISLHIALPNSSEPLIGKVINLSIGGLALQFENPSSLLALDKKQSIRSQFFINRRRALTNIKIVFTKENILGVKFDQAPDTFYELISQYLLERISE